MINLCNAITLEVGFQMQGYVDGHMNIQINDAARQHIDRRDWFCREVIELRANSGFTTAAEYRLIDAAFVIEAVAIKVDAYFRSLNHTGFKVHYENGGYPYHCKTEYKREADARRAAEKRGYVYSSMQAYVAKARGRIVINMMSRKPVMETTGTPGFCSVASESYWSA